MLTIGPWHHSSRVIVAPMAGVTDRPFRDLCRQFGAWWLVSEMISSDPRLRNTRKSRHRMQYHNESEPRWIQIAGAIPHMMAEAARFNADRGAQIIDINMGCPAKKVCNRAAGSALLRDERLVEKILTCVVDSVDIPVTLKIRLGWSREEQNAVRVARIAEEAGISLLTVHGRTRECKFGGEVDYGAIAEVKSAVSIPVVANGDIDCPERASEVLAITGADAVMIGRAAQGRPWLAGIIDDYLETGEKRKSPGGEELRRTLIRHLVELHQFYGEPMGVRIARKHVGWYLQTATGHEFRQSFNRLQTAQEQIAAIETTPFQLQEDLAA
ncbi:MAG: tRNA dihydrouridine synthase DusB [Pseudomonadales bacterium]|nr:tRNA dihydrouridine synthase DusB [Pseudomonadales bacterium]